MSTGVIKRYLHTKGYGFVCDDEDGVEVFFHISACPLETRNGRRILPGPGDRVSFKREASERGDRAKHLHYCSIIAEELVGEVSQYYPEKGFGFLVDPAGVEYFLHQTTVVDGEIPLPRDMITFRPGYDSKGRPRVVVARIKKG